MLTIFGAEIKMLQATIAMFVEKKEPNKSPEITITFTLGKPSIKKTVKRVTLSLLGLEPTYPS